MNCINKLQKLGYRFSVAGNKIKYKFVGGEKFPDAAVLTPLLAELKTKKTGSHFLLK